MGLAVMDIYSCLQSVAIFSQNSLSPGDPRANLKFCIQRVSNRRYLKVQSLQGFQGFQVYRFTSMY